MDGYLLLALGLSLLAAAPVCGPGMVNTRAGGDSAFLLMRVHQILANLDAFRPAPDPNPQSVPKTDPLTILIGPRGLVFQGAPKTETQLEYSLARIAKSNPDSTIIVKCTGDSPHGLLVRALDVCNKVGMRNLSVFSM